MAKTFRVRPSDLLGIIDNSYLAFCLDRAVWTFGNAVEYDMNQAEEDPRLGKTPKKEQLLAARQAVFEAYMNQGEKPEATPGKFADPMAAIRANRTGR
jgi:hypothetical protein